MGESVGAQNVRPQSVSTQAYARLCAFFFVGALALWSCGDEAATSGTSATCPPAEIGSTCVCPDGTSSMTRCGAENALECACGGADAGSDGLGSFDTGDTAEDPVDTDADTGPDETCTQQRYWPDVDLDGFGDPNGTPVLACERPSGYADNPDDCDDDDPFVYPGALELCDGVDNNCNGRVDENIAPIRQWPDADGDGYGDPDGLPIYTCERRRGYAPRAGDCDDTNPEIHPAAVEVCNGVDDNCNGRIDEGLEFLAYWPDADGDGYGDRNATPISACEHPDGFVTNALDCDDTDPDVHPDAEEICDLRDNNCNGRIDEGTEGLVLYIDRDGDGYGGRDAIATRACAPLEGYVANALDCDDTDPAIHPGATEVCDGQDNNCDGLVDVGAVDAPWWYADNDGDGYGGARHPVRSCEPLPGAVDRGGDCDDRREDVNPSAVEICNGIDDNCNGVIDEGVQNACGGCGPVPDEICGDGLDNNCNGVIDEGCACDGRTQQPCYTGPPSTAGVGICRGGVMDCRCPGDARFCDDGNWGTCDGVVLPSPEICNGLDDNCNGFIDEGVRNACGSCGPAPEEICNGLDDNCNGVIDEGVRLACGLCPAEVGDEICGDGIDNNCNGLVDEGCPCTEDNPPCYPGPPDTRDIGACSDGVLTCYAGAISDGVCVGATLPSAEVCDGIDNSCDGAVDRAPDGCSACGVEPEICDGVDNNCNGRIDEGLVNGCGQCLEDVFPEELGGPALCNGLDDDCDGLIDEGLLNACGTCGESCYTDTRRPSDGDALGDGAVMIGPGDPDNPTGRTGVTLSRSTFIPPYLWAANHDFHTVSKVNTETYAEDGRYWVGLNPSRTAVDLDGNMWVGGRDDGRLTKILWDTDTCIDRNGDGVITTSRNGALGPVNSPGAPLADECVAYSAVPNPSRTSIRGVAAGPDGRIWIGYTDGGIQSIHPYTFELGPFYDGAQVPHFTSNAAGVITPVMSGGVQSRVSAGGIYGLVVDSTGDLYISSFTRQRLSRFDTNTETWVGAYDGFLCGAYGIAVDSTNRVWAGGWPNCRGVGMFDPASTRFHYFTIPNGFTMQGGASTVVNPSPIAGCGSPNYCVTGVGVEPATGDVWASFYDAGYTGRLRVNDANLSASVWEIIPSIRDNTTNALLPGVNPDLRGIGFDQNGFAWTLGLGSNRVWRLDPATNRRATDLPNGAVIGQGSHYTYSDFTGSTALSFTAPRAFWRDRFTAGFANAQLDAITWEAYAPAASSVGIRVRALHEDGTAASAWVPAPAGDGSPVYHIYPSGAASDYWDLPGAGLVGYHFEADVRLTTSESEVRPIVFSIDFIWQRP